MRYLKFYAKGVRYINRKSRLRLFISFEAIAILLIALMLGIALFFRIVYHIELL